MYTGCVCLLRLSGRLGQSAGCRRVVRRVQYHVRPGWKRIRLVSSVRRMSVLSHIRGAQ